MFASTKQRKNGKGFQAKFFSTKNGPKIAPSLIPIAKEDFSAVNWNNLEDKFESVKSQIDAKLSSVHVSIKAQEEIDEKVGKVKDQIQHW